jgi:hypothetical protein
METDSGNLHSFFSQERLLWPRLWGNVNLLMFLPEGRGGVISTSCFRWVTRIVRLKLIKPENLK